MNWIKKTCHILTLGVLIFSTFNASANNVKLGNKSGILLVTFGSSYPAPQDTYKAFDKAVKNEFKDTYAAKDIQWGYTSTIILKELRKGEGHMSLKGKVINRNTPKEALEKMIKEGYSKFVVQSLNVIPGTEFDMIKKAVKKLKVEYPSIKVVIGKPLLYSDSDQNKVAKLLTAKFRPTAQNPIVFMGHGTSHIKNNIYVSLQKKFKKINSNIYLGTVEGTTSDQAAGKRHPAGDGTTGISSIVETLKSSPKAKVTITPLMFVAGNHANNDMNGSSSNGNTSWREKIEKTGHTVNPILKGLGDYSEIRTVWLNHIKKAIKKISK